MDWWVNGLLGKGQKGNRYGLIMGMG